MNRLELIESFKNTAGNAINIASDYAIKSIAPTLGKADLLIIILLGFVVLIFCYFDLIKKK